MGLAESTARQFRYLEAKDDILLLTTSSHYQKQSWDTPKTTELAVRVRARLEGSAKRVTLLDVTRLKIYTCEGNISGWSSSRIVVSLGSNSLGYWTLRCEVAPADGGDLSAISFHF